MNFFQTSLLDKFNHHNYSLKIIFLQNMEVYKSFKKDSHLRSDYL